MINIMNIKIFKNKIMAIYFLLFIYLFILSSQSTIDHIINDLQFNTEYEEDFHTYFDEKLPESMKYYVRFPQNFIKKFKFYIYLPKLTPKFQVYMKEFPNYPKDTTLNQTEFTKELDFQIQDDPQYDKYYTEIQYKEPYIVIYFKNSVSLNYLYLYAKTEITINDIDCNHKYEYDDITEGTKLYFRVNIEDYLGEEITINLNYEDLDLINNPSFNIDEGAFNVDVGTFKFYPEEGYLLSLDILRKDFEPLVGYDNYNNTGNFTMQYSFKTNDDVKYLIIQIEPKKNVGFFSLIISSNKKDSSFPIWIIAIIAVIALIIIFVIIAFVVIKTKCRCSAYDICCILCCCIRLVEEIVK